MGRAEGRRITFQADDYLASYGDLIQAFGDDLDAATLHYINYGAREGRVTDSFNELRYLLTHGDLQAAFGNNLDWVTQHYINSGFFEGRQA